MEVTGEEGMCAPPSALRTPGPGPKEARQQLILSSALTSHSHSRAREGSKKLERRETGAQHAHKATLILLNSSA